MLSETFVCFIVQAHGNNWHSKCFNLYLEEERKNKVPEEEIINERLHLAPSN